MAKWPYDTPRWKALRAEKLKATPNCELCPPGVVRKATCVDHKVAVTKGGAPFPPLTGLSSTCWSCHSAKTARGPEHGSSHSSQPMKATGIDGFPVESSHPCYEKRG